MSELQQRIDTVARKAALLTTRCQLLRREKAEALDRIALLEGGVETQARRIEELSMQLEYMTVVSVLEPSAKDRHEVRERLSRLLPDIDQCIADLSDCNER